MESELRGWINKLLVGFVALVVGYLGTELGEFRRLMLKTEATFVRLNERQAMLEYTLQDHEKRIRELEHARLKLKGD